jgi:4-amino-4-deoxy-L-arabinose transferase-like glycosyltransferase
MRAGRFAAIAALYVALATGSLLTLRPWCDEGWFSAPAHSLLTHGNMGTEVLDPTATWRSVQLTGIHEYTYWIMPLYPLAQAAWYKVAGFGLLRMRMLSMLWGLVAIAAWYIAVKRLSGDRLVALIAMGLTAIDFQFLWSASAGRMDMMAAALGFAGIAAYLELRERHFALAIGASHCLVAAGMFTHPVTATAFGGLIFLTLYYDRSSIRFRHVALAAAPYLIGAAGWGAYIAKNPALFHTQFGGNASDRWAAFTAPLNALWTEITGRYFETYGLASYTAGASRLKIAVLICYVWGAVACLASPYLRRRDGNRALLILTAIYFVMLPLIDGFKQVFYLVHIIPLLAALLAVWLAGNFKRRAARAVLACLVIVQLAVTGYRIKQNPYRNSYLESARLVTAEHANGTTIMGSAEWAWELGFDDHLVDDYRLGFRSGLRPDLIILDEGRYQPWIEGLAAQDPENYRYIERLLSQEYRVLDGGGYYKIYARSVR